MARAWRDLADQADRNSKADLVYEAAPPKLQQPIAQQQQQQQAKQKDDPES